MTLLATQDSTKELQPRSYSTPNYRDVQIASYGRTEARFLLWGAYFAMDYMVKFVRFHNVALELYFDEKLDGKMKIAARRPLSLADGGARDLVAGSNLTGSPEEGTAGSEPGLVGDLSDSDLAPLALNASAALAFPPGFSIALEDVAGARRLDRNKLFLTFYSAFLHVAEFPVRSQMRAFESESPKGDLHLHMQELELGCQVCR